MKRRVLLLGYTGQGNFGDDLLLKQAVDAIYRAGDVEVDIHTYANRANSQYLHHWFPDAQIIRENLGYRLVKGYDHVLYFGGGILFDFNKVTIETAVRRLFSQLRSFVMPRLINDVRFGGIGVGLGPFSCSKSKWLLGNRIRQFSLLGVRDLESLRIAHSLGLKSATLTPDLSLMMADGTQPMCAAALRHPASPKILVCPRHYPHGERRDYYLTALEGAIADMRRALPGAHITTFSFQVPHDEPAINRLNVLADKCAGWHPMNMKIQDVFTTFSEQDLVISSRMHGIFVAGITGTPSVSIGVDPKMAYASGFFKNSAHVSDIAGRAEICETALRTLGAIRGMPATGHLGLLAQECRAEYRRLTTWLKESTD